MMISTVWLNIYEKSCPIYLKEERMVSSFMLELRPNICENLQVAYCHRYLAAFFINIWQARLYALAAVGALLALHNPQAAHSAKSTSAGVRSSRAGFA